MLESINKKEYLPDGSSLVPKPLDLEATGLQLHFLTELLAKHLYDAGVLEIGQISNQLALVGPIVETLLNHLRKEAYVEVLQGMGDSRAIRFSLTDLGRSYAQKAFNKSGYLGPAPVTLEHYTSVVQAQTLSKLKVSRKQMRHAFIDLTINQKLLDQLGPAMNSSRPIFIYGPPGSGKTYTVNRLTRLVYDKIYIPHAIAIRDEVLQLFDPMVHVPATNDVVNNSVLMSDGYDPRFTLCNRPAVFTGGELTLDMLEITYDTDNKLQFAPLQLKASNGIFMIDDLGRQRVRTTDLFNRWIVPMDTRFDYLTLASGRRFQVQFDLALIFSTNMNPGDLADDAFLRRIGHKIHFGPLEKTEYFGIWKQLLKDRNIQIKEGVLDYLYNVLHKSENIPPMACHPSDLLGLAVDAITYADLPPVIDHLLITQAWEQYFIKPENQVTHTEKKNAYLDEDDKDLEIKLK